VAKGNKPVDQEFVETVVRALVRYPEEVEVVRTVNEMGVLLTIKVNPQDTGLVIGKKGRTINAIRELAIKVGYRNRARISIQVAEEQS
jgi:hypothetical protein